MHWSERLLVILILMAIPGVFAVALRLTPNAQGYGTHQQLGLSECFFLKATGRLCPHCGLTTSFAWLVRGEWKLAWRSNPTGLFTAAGMIMAWPWLFLVCVKGVWVGMAEPGRWFPAIFVVWLSMTLLVWLIRF